MRAGLAHVATVSFLATRAAPAGHFWIALAGGIGLGRVGATEGLRAGYGATIAAMLQTVAIMGPARFNGPVTVALSSPLVGHLWARGRRPWRIVLWSWLIRWAHYTVLNAFFIFVIAGGLDAFVGTYNRLFGWILPTGTAAALIATVISDALFALFFSTIQVMVIRRALGEWPDTRSVEPLGPVTPSARPRPRRFGPRLLALIALALFVVLLTGTRWPVLGAVAGMLAALALVTRGDPSPVRVGAALAGILFLVALGFGVFGGIGLDEALSRAVRAALLVLVATWLRAAAGADGLHEVGRAILRRLRWVPAVREATPLFGVLDSGPRLTAAGRHLGERLRGVRKRPWPVADALIGWVAAEAARFRPEPERPPRAPVPA